MAERPPLRRVRDHENTGPVELTRRITEEAPHPVDAIAVALTARVGSIDEAPARVELGDESTVQIPVVALPKARVVADLELASVECDLRCLDGAA
jgi:hypothetical protein